jgi:hypothetical protein
MTHIDKSKTYIIIIKVKDLLHSKTTHVSVFPTAEIAYDYACAYTAVKKKPKPLLEAIKTNIVWTTDPNDYPIYKCKILEIPCDFMWNLYQNVNKGGSVIRQIYTGLKTYNVI